MADRRAVALILSDVHLGDEDGVLSPEPKPGFERLGDLFVRSELTSLLARVRALVAARGARIPFLVIDGDVWDTAVRTVAEVAALSRRFFPAIRLDELFGAAIFVPGNHDHHLWELLQSETCILRPLERTRGVGDTGGTVVHEFPQAQSGFLDLGTGALDIPGVAPPYLGNVYVSALTGGAGLPVNVVYPNLHLCSGEPGRRETTLVTHGHFFELAWCLLSELFAPVLAEKGIALDLARLEMLNSPLTELINFSLAQQSGALAGIVWELYDDARDGRKPRDLDQLGRSLVRVLDEAVLPDAPEDVVSWLKAQATKAAIRLLPAVLTSLFTRSARGSEPDASGFVSRARWDASFLEGEKTRSRMASLVSASAAEARAPIRRLVFGHTHVAFPATRCDLTGFPGLEAWNTGGWVPKPGQPCSILPILAWSDGSLDELW